jgi:hypothetical protein
MWGIYRVPGQPSLHSENLSQKRKKKEKLVRDGRDGPFQPLWEKRKKMLKNSLPGLGCWHCVGFSTRHPKPAILAPPESLLMQNLKPHLLPAKYKTLGIGLAIHVLKRPLGDSDLCSILTTTDVGHDT